MVQELAASCAITLDIDDIYDTADTVHGHQQMSLFNAFHACPRT